jgi:hypothetical protein
MMAYLPTAIAPAAFRWLSRRDAPNKMMNVISERLTVKTPALAI